MTPVAASLPGTRLGPYSDAVRVGDLVLLSGRIALVEDGTLLDGDVHAQTLRAIANVRPVLALFGLDLADVVKCTVYLTDMADFAAMNAAYLEAFGSHRPARTTVAVAGLPLGAAVEIEMIAAHR